MKKKILSLVMALVLCFSFTVFYGYASQTRAVDGCEHVGAWTIVNKETFYSIDNSAYHSMFEITYYFCTNCGESFEAPMWHDPTPHSFGNRHWTGSHNHSGNTHSYTYESSCVCGATQTEEVVLPCPGNGNCYLPYSDPIESEIE